MSKAAKKYFIKPEDYWEWRTTIEECRVLNKTAENCELEHKILLSEARATKLVAELFHYRKVAPAKLKSKEQRLMYDKFVTALEERIGCSIKGKVIDEFTYEVRDDNSEPIYVEGD